MCQFTRIPMTRLNVSFMLKNFSQLKSLNLFRLKSEFFNLVEKGRPNANEVHVYIRAYQIGTNFVPFSFQI